MTTQPRAARPRVPLGRGVEYEFETMVLPREVSRNIVTRLLVDRAEHGGWELARLRITGDGKRRVVLRRKIIRQRGWDLFEV